MRLSGFALLILFSVLPTLALAKPVKLEWQQIEGAVGYELQLIKDGKVVSVQKTNESRWNGDIPFGAYLFQIRAVDRLKRPGVWSEAQPLIVMSPPPELDGPAKDQNIVRYHESAPLKLKWKPTPGATAYRVSILKDGKEIRSLRTTDLHAEFNDVPPGDLTWKVEGILKPQAIGRAPASSGKEWMTKPSEARSLEIELKELKAPKPKFPVAEVPPPQEGKMEFEWSEVSGAEAYRVRVGKNTILAKTNKIAVRIPSEGRFEWGVRALAHVDEKNVPLAESIEQTARFEVDRNSVFVQGSGYAAISTMLAPYNYRVEIPWEGSGSMASTSATLRVSAEHWFFKQFGVGAALEDTHFTISGQDFKRRTYELNGKYQSSLTTDRFGWFFAGRLGLEGRQYPLITLENGAIKEIPFITWGASAGFDIRKQLDQKWSLALKVGYFYPLTLNKPMEIDQAAELTGSESKQNINLGLQAAYWMKKNLGMAFGAYGEIRSLGILPSDRPTGSGHVTVRMNGLYFFGSVIYRWGD